MINMCVVRHYLDVRKYCYYAQARQGNNDQQARMWALTYAFLPGELK